MIWSFWSTVIGLIADVKAKYKKWLNLQLFDGLFPARLERVDKITEITMAITPKVILFCWQRAGLASVEVQRDVQLSSLELEGDNNLNLIENHAIYNILDKIGDDSDEEEVDDREPLDEDLIELVPVQEASPQKFKKSKISSFFTQKSLM